MFATTNSTLVWKRAADENLQSARMFARACMILIILLIGTGAYAYSSQSRYSEICSALNSTSQSAESAAARSLGEDITSNYCS